MAIPSRQIGWSTKSNLLWQISKQLEYLTGVLYKGTTTTTTTVVPIPFILTLDTTGQGDNYNVTLPYSGYTYTGTIDWGDGNTSANEFGANHTYITAGTYTVTISGTIGWFNIYYDDITNTFSPVLTSISQFGNQFSFGGDIGGYFGGCTSLTSIASDIPLSTITNMSDMFNSAALFNQDLSAWNVGSATNMNGMFNSATSFNSNIGGWDVGNVTNMDSMFHSSAFNSDISSWNVGNVTSMTGMFTDASAFNQDISGWNVSNVAFMSSVFYAATSFNQPLNSWNVSNVTIMTSMFRDATAFNQDISSWNIGNVTTMAEIFTGASSFSSTNLDAIYTTWSTSPLLQNGVRFDADICYDLSAQAGRDILTNAPNNWIITDGGICP